METAQTLSSFTNSPLKLAPGIDEGGEGGESGDVGEGGDAVVVSACMVVSGEVNGDSPVPQQVMSSGVEGRLPMDSSATIRMMREA